VGPGPDITALLQRSGQGDSAALAELMPLVYGELRALARAHRRRAPEQTLSTTALVHEAYLKLFEREGLSCADRGRFYAYAGKAMRSILLDGARRRAAIKRGGDQQRADDDLLAELPAFEPGVDMLAVDQALARVALLDERLVDVVEMHVFAGLEFAEIAECFGVSERTVLRDWRKVRTLLGSFLGPAS
jgi:RNA polymerase sigma factor (TIGR02999 family)